MRVHIISDMEGVAGIVRGAQTNAGEPLYEEGRKLYTEEINAAVRGAKKAGAKEIVVMDHHGAGQAYSFNSLIPDQLDPACEYVVQSSWTEYTGFLEEGCDACLLVGMHAMAGTPDGVLSHTVSGREWRSLRELELPRRPRHRRRGQLPGGDGPARRGPDDGCGQERDRPGRRTQHRSPSRARADRGRR